MKKEIIKTIEGELAVAKTEIDGHFPSLYTKENVKAILDQFADTITTFVSEEVKEKSSNKISVEGIEELKVALLGAITSEIDKLHSEDVVDFSTADFSIGFNNQVEIDSIDVNSDEINEVIEKALTDALHDFFEPEEEEEESSSNNPM